MLKQHSQLMLTLLIISDAVAITLAWLAAYWLRFTWLPVSPEKGIPALADKYLPMLPLVVLAHLITFYRIRLYRPRRERSLFSETRDILKAFVVAVVAVVMIDYALPATNKISRSFIATYAVVGAASFALFRGVVRAVLQALRRRGWNRRTAAIVGSGRSAQRLLHALRRNEWTGIEVLYFVDDAGSTDDAPRLHQVPVRGPVADIRRILEREPVDAVFLALSNEQAGRAEEILEQLETSTADVRLVPDINPGFTLRPNVSELDGVAILSVRQTPMYGWNALAKRAFDVVMGGLFTLLATVPMLVIALAIKLTSRGPVFYRQRRVGMDGREFALVKFRTMRADAEADGPVWSRQKDDRRTAVGAFLRRTSLDELPNLFNVLAGHLSLVGPRPERPEFIAQFKQEIPRYMLRHKIKAGMTGYAQVMGLRGESSLRKRIQYDLHYIRHWSLGLDVRILARTLVGAWFSEHEK
ncbi:MAG: UDP-glucose:undecaprenyl-phosphate glucose-1-phosphate transferase [Phycisphaerae bacterium]|nr:UDP-glucose:undecaprenyl-phosphate glucose-1-phosphate transferase [Phycisphaerae bacterium]